MRVVFHGGAGEVGRSCVEIAAGTKRLLLDCGLKLTPAGSEYPLGFDNVNDITAVFLTHAHLDHTGALPLLDHKGMGCPIFATKTTKALSRLILKDAFKVGRINHEHLGYDRLDIRKVLECMRRVVVDRQGSFGSVNYEYFDAGHIPGAASIFLNVDGKTFLYTGDINTDETLLLKAAETDFPDIDVMICESTYGDREHPPRQREEERFLDTIDEVIAGGGSVIVPVFALGRSQEVLLLLAKRKFRVPVFFDGMGVAATDIILSEPESVRDAAALKRALKGVRLIQSANDRSEAVRRQSIIVTTSGMLTGGPVMFYLKSMHSNPRHAVLLAGYQAEGTNGRMLLEKKQVYLDGWKTDVLCRVEQFDFSAHAGMSGLKALVRAVRPGKVFFVHGEPASAAMLREWASALGMDAYAPEAGEVFDV